MEMCPKCGSPASANDQFCHFCGTVLTLASAAPAPAGPSTASANPAARSAKRTDYVGIVSLGFFLLIVGVVFGLNPNAGTEFYRWVEASTKAGYALRPPETLLASTELFFGLATLSGLVTAGLRYAADRAFLFRPIADLLGATATLAFTVLVGLYVQHRISGPLALAIEAAVVGTLIVVYVGTAVGLSRRARHVRGVPSETTDRRNA